MLMTVLSVWSCKSRQQLTERVRIEREVVRDTVVTVGADSAMLTAWLECDSNNRVLMRRLDIEEGQRLKLTVVGDPPAERQTPQQNSGARWRGTGAGLKLTVGCKEESLGIPVQVRERMITDETVKTTIEYVEVEKPPSEWQMFLMVCGWILFVGVIIGIIITIIIAVWKILRKR